MLLDIGGGPVLSPVDLFQKLTLLRAIPTMRGGLEEGRAHVLTDYHDKHCLTCALTQCSDNTCSSIKSGMCSDMSSSIKAGKCSGNFWHVF